MSLLSKRVYDEMSAEIELCAHRRAAEQYVVFHFEIYSEDSHGEIAIGSKKIEVSVELQLKARTRRTLHFPRTVAIREAFKSRTADSLRAILTVHTRSSDGGCDAQIFYSGPLKNGNQFSFRDTTPSTSATCPTFEATVQFDQKTLAFDSLQFEYDDEEHEELVELLMRRLEEEEFETARKIYETGLKDASRRKLDVIERLVSEDC